MGLYELLTGILGSTLSLGTPLALAAIGGTFSARGGVRALGLEGMMIMGAFFGALGSYLSGSALTGLLCGVLGGMLTAQPYTLFCVRYRMNQVICGLALNVTALHLTTLLMQTVWGHKGSSPRVADLGPVSIGIFAELPLIGPALAKQSILFYLMLAAAAVGWIVLFKTRFGLRLRMVGEHPVGAQSIGLRVWALKYSGVTICGALCGLGGACLSLDQLNLFAQNMTEGQGYMALAVAVLAGYNPGRALYFAFLFGFFEALPVYMQASASSYQLIQMLPYVATVIVLTLRMGGIRPPSGLGAHHNY